MKRLLASVVLAATATLVGCGDDSSRSSDRPQSPDGPAQADIDNGPPYGRGVSVGETYEYVLYTHCGIEWARIDGVWWRTELLDDGNANPPAEWGNPYDAGRLQVEDDTAATYTANSGVSVDFERTDMVEAPFTCE